MKLNHVFKPKMMFKQKMKLIVSIFLVHFILWYPLLCMAGPLYLKQGTAKTILVGPFIDDSDFKTLEPLVDVTALDVKIVKDDMSVVDLTITTSGGTNDMSYITNGMYSLELTTSDTNTLGAFSVIIDASAVGALPLWENSEVISTTAYNNINNTTASLGDLSTLIRILQFKNFTNNSVFQ